MFNSDRPIETAEEDILKRTYFAKKPAFFIREIRQNESVLIGLQIRLPATRSRRAPRTTNAAAILNCLSERFLF